MDKDSLRSFLGLSEYYSRFIENYSGKVEPLRALLRKGQKFVWDVQHDHSFAEIKKAILTAPTLKPFDNNGSNVITVDASSIGLGAVFTQKLNSQVHTVAFISRRLTETEKNYSAIERRPSHVCGLLKN